MTPSDPTVAGDPLDPVVADYLQRVEAGQSPRQLVLRHRLGEELNLDAVAQLLPVGVAVGAALVIVEHGDTGHAAKSLTAC